MTTLSLAAILHASILVTGGDTYTEAREITTKTGRPMVVLVSADWCAACQTMKETVIPQAKRHGLLRKVAFAIVNLDRQRELGRKLTGGGPIPQLIMYRKSDDGWKRKKLIGGQSVTKVEKFISQGIELDEAERKEPSADENAAPTEDKQAAVETCPSIGGEMA